ncbi:hypothetical protein JEZ13_09575 [bacterium]|nr:hypothetical protein [bacterium]
MLKKSIILLFTLCFGMLSALGGFSTYGPVTLDTVDPQVDLLSPNGGESWYFGDTQNIQWTATDDFLLDDPILIEVSYSGNQNFSTLEENLENTGSYAWEFPEIETDNCYVQITATDLMGNSTSIYSASSFSLGYVPPQAPGEVNVDLSNGVDAQLSWQPVTQTIYNTPIIPDGYIILYNETPYEDDENRYYFLGFSPTPDYTHQHVASFRDDFYYSVKSFKNFSARQLALLEQLSANKQSQPLSWGQVKSRIQAQGGTK